MKYNASRFVGYTAMAIAVLCFINSFSTFIYKNSFWPFFLLLSLIFSLIGYIHLHVKLKTNNIFVTTAVRFIHGAAGVLILSFIIVEALIIASGNKKETTTPNYIVVLGAGLWGETPSLTLIQRLDSALSLLKVLPEDVKVIVSGGQGPGETIPEAEAMKRYLVKRGIKEDRIIKEDKSKSTLENMIFTKNLLNQIDSSSDLKITVVTSNFHMYRAENLAKKAGFEKVYLYSSPITPYLIPTYYIREYLAVINSVLFDRP